MKLFFLKPRAKNGFPELIKVVGVRKGFEYI